MCLTFGEQDPSPKAQRPESRALLPPSYSLQLYVIVSTNVTLNLDSFAESYYITEMVAFYYNQQPTRAVK